MTCILCVTIAAVILALLFDAMNGFHDAANAIATVVSTRVLSPSLAVLWAAFFNFIPMLIFPPHVADTISKIVRIEPDNNMYFIVISSGLLGAIIWNILTWWWELPTSSSHALIGGLSGAALAFAGMETLRWDLLAVTLKFIVIAPLLGFAIGFILIVSLYWLLRYKQPTSIDHGFRKLQLVSAALYSIGHGANDAQKTMGVIMALMVTAGLLHPEIPLSLFHEETFWIVLLCQLAMSLGTAFGGWRIVKTMGMKITKLKPIGGFCAETAGAATLALATHWGIPVSTTHTITGSIIGIGAATQKASRIKWIMAAKIIWAWILTIPAAAIISGLLFIVLSNIAYIL